MNLLDEQFFHNLKKKKNTATCIFIILCLLFTTAYVLSFFSNLLYVSVLTGIIAVVILVLFYYALVFDKVKLLKLYKNINSGIYQEDSFVFNEYDGPTEHDGVKLIRLTCTFTEDNETFDRTLYFIEAVPSPTLEKGQIIKVKTYQNIILNIED
jgi:hypothetical protein